MLLNSVVSHPTFGSGCIEVNACPTFLILDPIRGPQVAISLIDLVRPFVLSELSMSCRALTLFCASEVLILYLTKPLLSESASVA